MVGSRQVLVQVVLFQFWGRGYRQDDAMFIFISYSKSSLSGLSNEVLSVSEFISEGDQTKQNV